MNGTSDHDLLVRIDERVNDIRSEQKIIKEDIKGIHSTIGKLCIEQSSCKHWRKSHERQHSEHNKAVFGLGIGGGGVSYLLTDLIRKIIGL